MINGRQVFDCFPFSDELDILEIRLNVLDEVVDYFVLVESSRTFTGNKKPLYFLENKQRFSNFLNKIRHVVVDDLEYEKNCNVWQREFNQRNAVFRGIQGCGKEDFIILSDVDEIPNPKVIKDVINQDANFVAIIKQPCFYYFLNCKSTEVYDKAKLVKFKNIKSPQQIRAYPKFCKNTSNKATQLVFKWLGSVRKRLSLLLGYYKVYNNAGWHFAYMKTPEGIRQKVKDFSHTELDSSKFNKIELIDYRIKNLKDPFERNYFLERVEIDDSYPEYIIKSQKKYKHLVLNN